MATSIKAFLETDSCTEKASINGKMVSLMRDSSPTITSQEKENSPGLMEATIQVKFCQEKGKDSDNTIALSINPAIEALGPMASKRGKEFLLSLMGQYMKESLLKGSEKEQEK